MRSTTSVVRRPVPTVLALAALVAVALPPPPAAAWSPVDEVPPATIDVCRSSGGVDRVPFETYVKEVLAEEFPSSWPAATLQAGAVAVKSYAWYHVLHPYSSSCHLTDTTRHQKYAPEDPTPARTASTDAAVDATWHLRMEEYRNGETTPAYAQYCASCAGFPPGEHLDQYVAYDQGVAGWNALDILRYHYRNKSGLNIEDWRAPFGVAVDGRPPHPMDADVPLVLTAGVAGVPPGHPEAAARLITSCTVDGAATTWVVQTVGVTAGDGRSEARFDGADGLKRCAEVELVAGVELVVRGYVVATTQTAVWRPWRSAEPREVTRVADTADPVAGAIAVSQQLFTTAPEDGVAVAEPDDGRRVARAVVVARSDTFADALAATGLAGADAPILLNPGAEGLREDVRAEIDRVLAEGGTVHLVGGEHAVSPATESALAGAYDVRRHAGTSRVETATAVADAVRDGGGDVGTVLVARAYPDTSAGWADAVTGGAYAATRRHPVLLTAPDALHPATESWIEANAVSEAVLLGGTAAVPPDAEQRLGVATTRVAGAARDGTALAVADQLWTRPGSPPIAGAILVDVYDDGGWPFALAGAVLAANRGLPQLAVTRLVPRHTTGAWLDARPGLPVTVLGDASVVTDRVVVDARGG